MTGKSSSNAMLLLCCFSDSEIEKIANAPACGMGNDAVMSVFPDHRDRAIQSVIETQRALSRVSNETRSAMLRRRHLSRASAEFAKIIAEGDVQVAAAILCQ